ncbi:MAG: M24 family metallopeptidase [Chloroflexota bacterium]|nr:M24 family metallopeptidase [Chloroflexota bacterium]
MANAHLATIELPDFGMPSAMPVLPPELYPARLEQARQRAAEHDYDVLVVYADREHSANLSHLSGFDPRFEEAILFIRSEGDPLLLAGNECVGMAKAAPLPMRVELWQDLSLNGMPRDRSRALAQIVADEGVVAGARVGVVGWKYYDDRTWLEVPSFLADTLRAAVGPGGSVENANGIFIDAANGLRTINEVEQLAAFEYASCHTSEGVKRLFAGLRPGMTEQEAVQLLQWNGSPLSCHLMLTAGPRATMGLYSPSDRRIERGDRFTTAFGIWGALECRAGFVVEDASELPDDIADYVERLVSPYFEAIAEWLEAVRVGQTGGALHEIIERHLGDPFFGIFLNAGHQIGLDEWVNSPVHAGPTIELRSGMAMQVDVIPATGTEYFTTNMESGIALADAKLRAAFATQYPDAWARIEARRVFVKDELGIELHEDVLPLSNLLGCVSPFLLRPDRVMVR